jgi:hypothetical protein
MPPGCDSWKSRFEAKNHRGPSESTQPTFTIHISLSCRRSLRAHARVPRAALKHRQWCACIRPDARASSLRLLAGDIWFFSANKAYDQATGVGAPDVANLLVALRALDQRGAPVSISGAALAARFF